MSSQKRELQKKKREKAIRKAKTKKSIRNIFIGVAVLLLVAFIGYAIYYNTILLTRPISNYSEGLADDGTIKDIVVKDYVELCDYNAMEVNYNDLAPAKEEIDNQIDNILQNHKEYSTESGQVVELLDTINLNYVGKIDGVAFEGGSTPEGGTEIVVGEAGFIDDFEEQLVGKTTGSSFDIEVTFPEDYQNAEVAGKDAVFSITLNGIYIVPEFNDAFVKEYLSDYALTADAYRQYLEEEGFRSALKEYVQTYIANSCAVLQYPEKYVEDVMGITKYDDVSEYESMNEMYYMYLGEKIYSSFKDYVIASKGVASELEYEAYLRLQAQKAVAERMTIQAIYEDAGLTVTSEHLNKVLADKGSSMEYMADMEAMYGKGYIYQLAMKEAVIEYLMDNIKVIK